MTGCGTTTLSASVLDFGSRVAAGPLHDASSGPVQSKIVEACWVQYLVVHRKCAVGRRPIQILVSHARRLPRPAAVHPDGGRDLRTPAAGQQIRVVL